MKRTVLKRGKPLRSSGKGLKRSKLKRVNAARQDKRRAAYSAYLRSKVWKSLRAEALERAGNQCERWHFSKTEPWDFTQRCTVTEGLSVHHLKYPKVLGTESLDTLEVLCQRHHELVEHLKWWRQR